jgi:hypothetical protein
MANGMEREKAVFGNKDVFEGNYYQDQRHGYGVYKWHDGREYLCGRVLTVWISDKGMIAACMD